MIWAGLTGFATGFSLILAIGAQNTFVLRQGLARQHVFALCLLCAVSDALLIGAGVLGFSTIIAWFPNLPQLMAWAGAAFLVVYGALRLHAAWIGDYQMEITGRDMGLWATLGTAMALTWLNPHVYLDTVGLIGAISTQYDTDMLRLIYFAGATLASFVFFFALGFGARFMAPLMTSARSWRVLDVIIGIVMWLIAIKLLM